MKPLKKETAIDIFEKHRIASGVEEDFDYKFIIDAMEEYGQERYSEGYEEGHTDAEHDD